MLGIARGGIVVARPIAEALTARLDVVVVRKLGLPGHPEAGFGAIGERDVLFPPLLQSAIDGNPSLAQLAADEREELERQVTLYGAGRDRPELGGKTVVVIDDGIATGFSFVAAVASARMAGAVRVIGAAPVASLSGAELVRDHCDESHILVVERAGRFAVSPYYGNFTQVSDDEVLAALNAA